MKTETKPQWIAKMYPGKSGRDHLGLGSVSSDQILPSLSPGISVLTFHPRYHSFYVFLLDEYWKMVARRLGDKFPRGFMNSEDENKFILEPAIDWLIAEASNFPKPFLGYFHFWPPHSPYNTRLEFVDAFLGDGWAPPRKPYHMLQTGTSYKMGLEKRRYYDEFLLYVDAEYKRLYDALKKCGLLESTWLIFTSDHGEMFGRGFLGHIYHSLHQPVVRIPLMISAPGQTTRKDGYIPTSNVDILPTLLHITHQSIPDLVEGQVLPPFADVEQEKDRAIFSLMANKNGSKSPILVAIAMIIRDNYKFTRYFGYDQLGTDDELLEMYDLANDPEELDDLTESQSDIAKDLYHELDGRMRIADIPYRDPS